MINKILCDDVLTGMRKIPDKYVNCIITSPPYWQLRDYGYPEQWGLEPTYQEYLEHLWQMMDEIWRVLRDDGTCWINLGDTYSAGGRGSSYDLSEKQKSNTGTIALANLGSRKPPKGVSAKCLLLIPHRFAIGCIDRGWILRNDIIWAKVNGMPESVTDRFSKKHEYIFFFVKQKKYYFDLDNIRDKIKVPPNGRCFGNNQSSGKKVRGEWKPKLPKGKNPGDVSDFWENSKYGNKNIESEHRQGMHKSRGLNVVEKRPYLPEQSMFVASLRENYTIDEIVNKTGLKKSTVEHWFRFDKSGFSYPSKADWELLNTELWKHELCTVIYETDGIEKNSYKGKNPGDVSDFWDIPTKPSKRKHYATYNFDLISKPIIAGCPEGGIILDPFCGTGTTLIRAEQLNRKWIGIDASEEYCKIARELIQVETMQMKIKI